MMNAIMRGDGDPSASRWPMGCGEEALLVRYHTGHGTVAPRDQVQFEIAAAYRRYHAALMYVILTGEPDPRHRHMFEACADALDTCEAALRPGNTVGEVFAAHAEVLSKAGTAGISSMPAAIRWGRPIRRPGWIGRCSMPASRRYWRRTWCSFCT